MYKWIMKFDVKKTIAWKKPGFKENYYRYIEQGMDEFEARTRAGQHIVRSGNLNLTKEDIEYRRLFHEYSLIYLPSPIFNPDPPISFKEWVDQRDIKTMEDDDDDALDITPLTL